MIVRFCRLISQIVTRKSTKQTERLFDKSTEYLYFSSATEIKTVQVSVYSSYYPTPLHKQLWP